ncbi:ATP-binding cassette domain-containing protein [Actinospongicola halichondriae]|uniref:ATP-binding cassette domain-containing protein n=1 Tax=Actinospongicola halichondriae TaxID=3236844 RepID=UPI003D4A1DD9
MPVITARDLTVEYPADGYVNRPIDHLDARIGDGTLSLLLGPSGCGKTTLLSCLGGLRRPTGGSLQVDGIELTDLSDGRLLDYRRRVVGYVFQSFNLIASLDALDNVAAPLVSQGVRRRVARDRARRTLDRVGMADHMSRRPGQLSGGQQQRVAVARGLVHDPALLLADEPTANLDFVQAEAVITLLRSLAVPGRSVIVSTHDDRLLPIADEAINLRPTVDETVDVGVRHLADSEVLFHQGDRGTAVYVVDEGAIEIARGDEVLHRVGPGAYFGELGPMMGQPRSATARAVGHTVVTALTVQEFRTQSRHAAMTGSSDAPTTGRS